MSFQNALDAALKKKGSLEDNAKNHEKRLQTEKAKLEELETIAQQADAAFEVCDPASHPYPQQR